MSHTLRRSLRRSLRRLAAPAQGDRAFQKAAAFRGRSCAAWIIEGPAAERVLYFDPPTLVDRPIDEVAEMPRARCRFVPSR